MSAPTQRPPAGRTGGDWARFLLLGKRLPAREAAGPGGGGDPWAGWSGGGGPARGTSSARRVGLLWQRDLVAAIRDGRIAIALVVPVLIAVFYASTAAEPDDTPAVTMAVAAEGATEVPEALRSGLERAVDLTVEQRSAADARDEVADGDADLALVVPEGFDADVRAGAAPSLEVVLPRTPDATTQSVVQALDGTLRALAGQDAPATVTTTAVDPPTTGAAAVLPAIGLDGFLVVFSLVFLALMIALLALPVLIGEEFEKRTVQALALVATDSEILAAKLLVGLTYAVLGGVLTMVLTGIYPEQPLSFALAALALVVVLAGFGLLLGVLVKDANKINTWSGFVILVLAAPAFLVLLPGGPVLQGVLDALPMSQAMRLMLNAQAGQELFPRPWLAWLVIAVWLVIGYALLRRTMARARVT